MSRGKARPLWRYGMAFAVLIVLLGLVGGIVSLQKPMSSFAHVASVSRKFTMDLARPHYWNAGLASMGMQLACQSPNAAARCYTPTQIQNAYHITPLINARVTGKGHTIVIVDAFQSPTIRHDLQMFDRIFGLKDPVLRIFAPDGLAPFQQSDPVQADWAAEITLDVEWAHAVAPDAAIDLVLANPLKGKPINSLSDFLMNILRATSFAINNNLGDVISQSFGGNEVCATAQALQVQHQIFQTATAKHITLLAASGDRGVAQDSCASASFMKGVSTPASDPLVTAVGGTMLNATAKTGTYMRETAWIGSGGGFSAVYPRPTYQKGARGIIVHRGVPDVAYNADPRSGVLVIWSSSGQGKDLAVVFGGTSAGSPQWAGITVLINQAMGKRIGSLNGPLYHLGSSTMAALVFHDITSGNNSFIGHNANGASLRLTGFNAVKGWDPVTGLGTPNVAMLVKHLPLFV